MERPRPVHQLTGALHEGDAVGNEILAIRELLRARGHASEIVAGRVDPPLAAEAHPLRARAELDGEDVIWLYHFSPGSPAGAAALAALGRVVVVYHNVTPARTLARWSAEAARLALRADDELRRLAGVAALALAKSRFSLADLEAAGFARRAVLPFVHAGPSAAPPSRVFRQLYGDGRTNVLCVGRVAPNKGLLELVAAFAVLQRALVPRSRLLLVGDTGFSSYARAVLSLARDLRLRDVVLCGRVDEAELRAAYSLANVYASLSDHEGYGVPLVEAMLADVPVVAFDAGAVAETLDGAGVLLGSRDPALVAGVIERLAADRALRDAVVGRQRIVAERIRRTDFGRVLLHALAPVLESAA